MRDTQDDARVWVPLLEAASRLVEQHCGDPKHGPRVFNQSVAPETREIEPTTWRTLSIDDVVSLDHVYVDTDGTGAFSTEVPSTDYLLKPFNAVARGDPFVRLELLPYSRQGYFPGYVFPGLQFPLFRVRLEGTFGWPSVPSPIREATIMLARQMRDLQKSGMTLVLDSLDQQIRMAPGAAKLLDDLQRQFKRRTMAF